MKADAPFALPARYVPLGERREGGQAFVYIYEDSFLQRKVAVKVMKDVADLDGLQKELSIVQGIRSRYIAELYELVHAKRSSMVALIQEFVPGESLNEWSKSTGAETILQALYQLAAGLGDIHRHKKIHRDIKPENLRFDDEGVLKILDFGLGQAAEGAFTINSRGTLFYLAPEMYAAPPIKVTQAVDTYAFGVVAAFLLNGGSLPAALRARPSSLAANNDVFEKAKIALPPEVRALLSETLCSDPAKRPTMLTVFSAIKRRLLFGKHRAFVSYTGQEWLINIPGQVVNLTSTYGAASVSYDGLGFTVVNVVGEVYINNLAATSGTALPSSCVLTFGDAIRGRDRAYVTIDLSHPEVAVT
jgi:eukaryotic-like serine/threonine-protein kinase